MVSSFLDKTGLAYLWGKITALVGGKQDALTFDSTPTANSTNPVTSAGIKAYVDENAGGDVPVENGTGAGSVQSKTYVIDSTTYTQNASGDGATAIGENTVAKGEASSARGINTLASGKGSSAEGYGNVVTINVTCDAGSANASYTETSTAFPSGVSTAYILDPSDSTLYYVASINSNTHTFRMVPAPESAMSNKTMVVMVHCASGQASHTEGSQTWAAGNYSHAEGYDTKADNDAAHAEGFQTKASGVHSHVEGRGCTASSEVQHVQGKYNIVDSRGTYAHIVGNGTGNGTGRSNAHTLDWSGNAWYAGKVSAGTVANPAPVTNANDLATKAYVDANAGGDAPVESGTGAGSVQTKEFTDAGYTYTQSAFGVGSFAEGTNTIARGQGAHVEGSLNIASGSGAHAEGYNSNDYITTTITTTSTNTKYVTYTGDLITTSHVGFYLYCPDFGSPSAKKIKAVSTSNKKITLEQNVGPIVTSAPALVLKSGSFDVGTHSEGRATVASHDAAHSEGGYTVADGEYSHAEGSNTSATASSAHSEGYYTSATALSAHAEGNYTMAIGQNSHAEGYYTKASSINQHVEGKYNVADTINQYAHITGIGTSESDRRNGFTVDWNGNGVFRGKVSVGDSYSASTDNDLITKGFFKRETAPTILEESTDVDNYGIYPEYADPDTPWSGHFLIIYDFEVGYENWDSPPVFSKIVLRITQPSTHGASDDDTIYLPLTKYVEFHVNDIPGYFQRMVFGNNERVYVADETGHFFLESEYPYPSGS